MSTQENENGLIILAAIVFGIPMLLVWKLANAIGADFSITLDAVLKSAAVFGIAIAVIYFLKPKIIPVICFGVAIAGLFWWPVIDNIAGKTTFSNGMVISGELTWYTSYYTKIGWSLFFAIVGIAYYYWDNR